MSAIAEPANASRKMDPPGRMLYEAPVQTDDIPNVEPVKADRFVVLHLGVGEFKRDDVFSRAQFSKLHPVGSLSQRFMVRDKDSGKIVPGDIPEDEAALGEFDQESYVNVLLNRLIGLGAIRPTNRQVTVKTMGTKIDKASIMGEVKRVAKPIAVESDAPAKRGPGRPPKPAIEEPAMAMTGG